MKLIVNTKSKEQFTITNAKYVTFLDIFSDIVKLTVENFNDIELTNMRGDLTVVGDSTFKISSTNVLSIQFTQN